MPEAPRPDRYARALATLRTLADTAPGRIVSMPDLARALGVTERTHTAHTALRQWLGARRRHAAPWPDLRNQLWRDANATRPPGGRPRVREPSQPVGEVAQPV